MVYRKLTQGEITQLKNQGCKSDNWNSINVHEDFDPQYVEHAEFHGDISIGKFSKNVNLPGGLKVHSGLYNCRLFNCKIGNDCFINHANSIANYNISNNVIIENIDSLIVDGETYFGNGTEIDIVNEGGGRTIRLFNKLSSTIAYMLVFYRHNPDFISKLKALITKEIEKVKSDKGTIANGARIINCRSFKNVNVGPDAEINGAVSLTDGSINSSVEDPVFIGHGVIATKFVILSGSKVTDGSILHNCFIGQSCKVGNQFSAENTALFANSEAFHGEACSVFGGPYTVTHHKSSLLIAGLYSFYNAGSGTNQSNHMYKLGPIHQGVLERGSKTGSFSYLLWPSKVGPFTTVLGKHYANFDTSDLPFSYINEEDGKSFITPAMNMFTVGTRRDSAKWPARDKRKAKVKLDLINFDLFSPFVVGKMLNAIEQLTELYENTPRSKEIVLFKGINLRRLLLKSSKKFYEMGVKIFIGNCLLKRLGGIPEDLSIDSIRQKLNANTCKGLVKWVDIAGLLATETSIKNVMDNVIDGTVKSVDALQSYLSTIHHDYDREEWQWCACLIQQRYGMSVELLTTEILQQIISDWKTNKVRLNNMVLQDALKEFDPVAHIGFGIDGGKAINEDDFNAVRGNPDQNSFIEELIKESKKIEDLADKFIETVKSCALKEA